MPRFGRVVIAALLLAAGGPCAAQVPGQTNPVYVDDSPAANDTLVRLREHLASGNLEQGASVLQTLLLTQADRVIASTTDAETFISVRARVHDALLSSPELMARYRAIAAPRAARLLEESKLDELERSYLLTPEGFDAVLRLTQRRLEAGAFEAARLTLVQLDGHPDKTGQRATIGAGIAMQIARYIGRGEVLAWASGWAGPASAPVAAPRFEPWPEAALARGISQLEPGPVLDAKGLVDKPLWSVIVNPSAPAPDPTPQANPRGTGSLPTYARDLLVLPAASGDTVVLNDGASISAWDRFTLSPRWTVSPGAGEAPRDDAGVRGGAGNRLFAGRMYANAARGDDLGLVSIAEGVVVAATGKSVSAPATGGQRDLLDRVLGLDLATGRTRWSVELGQIDPVLGEASVRGAPLIVEGTVILAARKYQPERRLVSLTLVGLDLHTGAVRWMRPVGSAGSMPWVSQPGGNDLLVASRGVVYRMDRLGTIAAIEAATGRTVWIRRSPVDASSLAEAPLPWQAGVPIVQEQTLLTISTDGRTLMALDTGTGGIAWTRPMDDFGSPAPKYLLTAGGRLIGVGDDRLASVSLSAAKAGRVEVSQPIASPGIRGRVSVLGAGEASLLMVPTVEGLRLYDPVAIGRPKAIQALEESGQVLALESQVIVADDTRLHSYLLWEVAERILLQRVKAAPSDPAPAVTFAELAHRAGKPERIGEAVDMALAALRQAPAGEATTASRTRLMEVLQTIIIAGLDAGAVPAPPGASSNGPAPARPVTDRALLAKLIAAVGNLAGTSDERVSFLLAAGRLAELDAQPERASAEYQKVLDDATLASATWRGAQLAVRAELEATRRLEQLLKAHGPAVYAAQEARAGAEMAALGATPAPEQIEGVVARFPLSGTVVDAYVRLAEIYNGLDKSQASVGALEAGLRAVRRIPSPPMASTGELGGRLIEQLRASGQTASAASALRALRQRFPDLVLTRGGAQVDIEKLQGELVDALAASTRWPRVGPVTAEGAQVIVGASIMEPLLSDPTPTVSNLLVVRTDEGVSAYTPTTAGQAKSGEAFVKAWSRQIGETTEPHLIRLTRDGAYVLYVSPAESWIERLGPTPPGTAGNGSGISSRWKSESLVRVFNREDSRQMRRVPGVMADAFGITGEGLQDPRNLLVSMDDRTIVVIERSGRAVGIDAPSGEILWGGRTAVSRVADVQVLGGSLVVAGDSEVMGAGNRVSDLRPVVQVLDARTGRGVQRLDGGAAGTPAGGALPGGHPRWVRLTDSGTAVIGLDSAVACIDLASAQTNWTITEPKLMPASAAWLVHDSVLLMGPDRAVWLAGASSGRLRPVPLEIPRTHVDSTRTLDVLSLSPVPGSGFVVVGQQGLASFSAEGGLLGVDAFGGGTAMIAPRAGEGRSVAIETVSEGRTTDGLMLFNLHALDSAGAGLLDSRAIILGARPTSLRLLDDRVALTAGSVTVILDAPARK